MIKMFKKFNNYRNLTRHRINLNACIEEELKVIKGKKIINFGGLKVELKNKFWKNVFFKNKEIINMNISDDCDVIINDKSLNKYKEFSDILFCIEVIQCVEDLTKLLYQIKNLTKKNGIIILSIPSSTPFHGFAGEKVRPTPHFLVDKIAKLNIKLLKIYKFGSLFDIFIDGLRRNKNFLFKILFFVSPLLPMSKKSNSFLTNDLDRVYSGFVFVLKRK